jgi:hypothetical protein
VTILTTEEDKEEAVEAREGEVEEVVVDGR